MKKTFADNKLPELPAETTCGLGHKEARLDGQLPISK